MPWQVIDYQVTRLQSRPCVLVTGVPAFEAVVGEVVIRFNEVPLDQLWRVERLSFTCQNPSGSIPQMAVFDQAIPNPGTQPIALGSTDNYQPIPAGIVPICGSRDGDQDSGDFGAPITVLGGSQLSLFWRYVEAGVVAYARLQYAVYKGTPSQPQPVAGAKSARAHVPVFDVPVGM